LGAGGKLSRIALIGGSAVEELPVSREIGPLETPYGKSSEVFLIRLGDTQVLFMPRHGVEHSLPPHRVNYRANVWALKELEVERIVATNAVGAINPSMRPGDLVVPHDLIDFTKLRPTTFYDEPPVTHVDVSQVYCPEVRRALVEACREAGVRFWDHGVLVCTEGPRFETPAEIRVFRLLGADLVGMTGFPEPVLARELGMCYATLCFVSNMAAGLQDRVSVEEVLRVGERVRGEVVKVLLEAIPKIPERRDCPCVRALESARFGGRCC